MSQQLPGLIGSDGILPVQAALDRFANSSGDDAFFAHPTLCWLEGSDHFLGLLSSAGVVLSLLIIFGIISGPALALCWIFYLSLVNVGNVFLYFQWDSMLLEAGFLAILLTPWRWFEPPLVQAVYPYSNWILWLLRWLLFRLMFCSALVKLWCDPCWRDLTALYYHYQTQPLPNVGAWYAHQLPHWFQRFSAGSMFFIELIVPLFIFGPRPLKVLAGVLLCFFQGLIALTGNYGYFNLLTVSLSCLLFDDALINRFAPQVLKERFTVAPTQHVRRIRTALAAACTVVIVVASTIVFWQRWHGPYGIPTIFLQTVKLLKSWQIVNAYGLFWVIDKTRLELVIQGSNDFSEWKTYEFRYKPGDLQKAPIEAGLFFPRLDWVVTFAAYGQKRDKFWFNQFIAQLFQDSPSVVALLKENPFPGVGPEYIRVNLYDYQFTNFQERQLTGNWWKRSLKRTWYYSKSGVYPEHGN